jgi:hypothetical protein
MRDAAVQLTIATGTNLPARLSTTVQFTSASDGMPASDIDPLLYVVVAPSLKPVRLLRGTMGGARVLRINSARALTMNCRWWLLSATGC